MSNPPPAAKETRLDPLVTPAAPGQHDCSKEAELSRSNPRHHLSQVPQTPQQVESPSRAESPTTVRQCSQPGFALKRSTTIPLETPSRSETVHSPQLSERDSIFATHYLPSDSGASTPQLPPEKDSVNDQLVNAVPGLDDVSGFPSSVSKVSTHRSNVDPSHMEVDVHRHIPLRSANLFSSPSGASRFSNLRSSISISDQAKNQEVEGKIESAYAAPPEVSGTKSGVSTDDLAEHSLRPSLIDDGSHPSGLLIPPSFNQEGSMVGAKPAFHTTVAESSLAAPTEHTSSRGRIGRVDSSIEANLANAEPASKVRSRKSSHYLGLFKENTTSPDRKRREDRARVQDEHMTSGNRAMETEHERPPSSEEEGVLRKSISLPSLGDGPSVQSPSMTEPSYHDEHEPKKRRPPALPRSLLDEIRNFHLTPGGGRGSSFSKSIPQQYAERGRDYFQQEPHIERFSEALSSLEEDDRGESLPFEDDEDREQISSAVYFPHERVASPEGDDVAKPLAADAHNVQTVQLSAAEKGHELMLVSPERDESPDDQEVSHVDITFRSKNESKILHGELPELRSPTEDVPEKSLGTISERSYDSTCESEFASADESSQSLHDDSSVTDDAEVTPTATPTQRSRLLSKRKTKASGPLGAVELKPYRHQVGGHTTVFRFSRRAVCKQLNNRENEFYERIERRHPDMLVFLPRYV